MSNVQSPRTDDEAIEQKIKARSPTAPRVTPADIEANIASTEIVKHISASGQILRWTVLTTKCGYAVAGRPSASVSSDNDDAQIGEAVAIANARAELWPLMGYALKVEISKQQKQGT